MTSNELNIMHMHGYSNYCRDKLNFISAAKEKMEMILERAESSLTHAWGKFAGISF